jgi:hypothetical protein
MAQRTVSGIDPNKVQSGKPSAGALDDLLPGLFVGKNSSGDVVLATFAGVPARGVLLNDAQLRDFRGNAVQTNPRVSFDGENGVRVDGFSGLVPGSTYYLSSGGGIHLASGGGAFDQEVGWADSDTVLVLNIGPALY